MEYDPQKPFNDLPLLFPDNSKWKTIDVLEQLNVANKALAELKGRLSAIPNPQIFINTLALQEAKDSSAIENVFTTHDKLFRAFTSEKLADPATKEVLRYGKALTRAFSEIKNPGVFSGSFIENIYRNIKDENDGIRDSEVYVGNPFERVYTPPCCEKIIREKLSNWTKCARDKGTVDPLIKMALLHYQFEAIHPFKDGNGRTGRVLNVLYLSFQGLLDEPVLYLSNYINTYKNKYYKLLRKVTETGDWCPWVLYMLKAVEETAKHTLEKVLELLDLFESTKEKIQKETPKIYSYELLEVLFTQVYCKYEFLIKRNIASRNTASNYLNTLVEAGILEKEKEGNEFIFRNILLYNLFGNF
jgi:Fic family protein